MAKHQAEGGAPGEAGGEALSEAGGVAPSETGDETSGELSGGAPSDAGGVASSGLSEDSEEFFTASDHEESETMSNRRGRGGRRSQHQPGVDEEEEEEEVKPTERLFHPEELKQLIPLFREGGGVTEWILSIDHYREMYLWTEKTTLLYATCRLAGAAQQWFTGSRQMILSWADFMAGISLAFPDHEDEADIHRKLGKCVKDVKESYENYVFRVNAMGQRGRLSAAAIIKYTISGLSYDPLYNSIASKRYATIYELLEQIRYCESNQELCKKRTFVPKSFSPRPSSNNATPKKEETRVAGPAVKRSDECFNCHGSGHISINCPEPQRRPRCSHCNKVGHDEQTCFKRNRNQGDNRQAATGGARQEPVAGGSGGGSGGGGGTAPNAAYPIEMQLQKENQPNDEKFLSVDANSQVSSDVIVGGRLKAVKALADSGCPVSLIKQSFFVESIQLSRANDRDLVGVNDSKIQIVGAYSTSIIIDSNVYLANFTVVTDNTMKVDMILGRRFLQDNGFLGLKFKRADKFDVDAMKDVFDGDVADASILFVDDKVDLDIGDTDETRSLSGKVYELFDNDYLNRDKPCEPVVKHTVEIKLKEDRYYNATPQRLSEFERREQNKIVSDMLSKGIIRESESPYSCRVVLTRKKNGEYRFCVNFRPLNKLVERNHFPLPIIEDQIAKLQNRQFFTTLDMKNGFYHVDIAENSRKYLSFVTEEGQFEYNKLPFGFTNSPSIFARYVMKVLKPYIDSGEIVVFIDDILASTVTISDHLDLLSRLFRTLSDNHIELNVKKCSFLKTCIEFLGYYVTYNQIRPSDRHIENVSNFPVPTNDKSLQRFLGLMSYFRKFIFRFNNIANPLYDLLNRKESQFRFEPNHFESFERLKNALISKPVLSIYSPQLETQLHTDASSTGYGGILIQRQIFDNQFHPVMFFSRKTSADESKLHSFELETLAVFYSLERFRVYVFGIHITIVTDCNALKATLARKDVNRKIARWALFIDEFDHVIEHRSGAKMQHVDALSRMYCHVIEETDQSSNVFENALYVNQIKDPAIIKIKSDLENGDSKDYEVRDNLVFRKYKNRLLLYVPANMEESIFYKYHDGLGHFGVDKVCELVKRSYWFPKLRPKLQDHIAKCVTCIAFNPKQKKLDGPLHLVDKSNVPFRTVHIDHLGPLEKTKGKNEHILAVIDAFTKYVKFYPTKTTNSREVLKHLKSYFIAYSTPDVIVSDRGTAFTSDQFKAFANDHGFRHQLVATACPQANGQVERYNRTAIPLISKLVETRNVEWDTALIDAEFLLNNTLNRSIGDIPSRLLFGVVQKRYVSDDLTKFVDDLNMTDERDLIEIRENASQATKKLQEYNKELYDKRCKVRTHYHEGDLVSIRSVKQVAVRGKLQPKFKGPYVVQKVLDRNRYVISDLDGYQVSNRRFEGIFDPMNMRLYQKGPEEEIGDFSDLDSDTEYEEIEYLDEEFQ